LINTFIHDFETLTSLNAYIKTHITNTDKLLVQIFFHTNIEKEMLKILSVCNELLPDAHIVGTTTDGSIHKDNSDTNKTVISFTTFEKSTLQHILLPFDTDQEEDAAQMLCDKLLTPKSKLLIIFADGLFCNIGGVVNAIHTRHPDVIIAGGLAGDNAEFKKTLVCDKHSVSQHAIVALSINSDVLKVHNDYTLAWKSVGGDMEVTKCNKNIIYEINNENAMHIYQKYLNTIHLPPYQHTKNQPTVGINFPFLIKREAFDIARAGLNINDDGSIYFAGEFEEGDKLAFSFTNEEQIIKSAVQLGQRVAKKPVQTIFVYSCMARRRFMEKNIYHDLEPLIKIAPVSGFYTYGEIYSAPHGKELLNHTMTIVALSEENEIYCHNIDKEYSNDYKDETFDALLHLLTTVQKEAAPNNDTVVMLSNQLQYHTTTGKLFYNNTLIKLSKSESLCFEKLFLNMDSKQPLTAESIIAYVWNDESKTIDSVRNLIKKLRKKIPEDIIKNVYGGMYKLDI